MRIFGLILIAIAAALALAGCAGSVESAAEREIEQRAPELIAPADRYDATVRGLTANTVSSVTITGSGVRPEPNLLIDTLTLTLTGVRFQRQPFAITSVQQARFSGRVSESAINNYIQQQTRPGMANISNARVEFLQGRIQVSATASFAGITAPVTTTGRLQVRDGLRIDYVPETIEVGAIVLPATVQGILAGRVNPITDLSGLRFTPRIETLTLNQGELHFSGTADIRWPER